ncbi:MAG: hypothetical protein GY862_00190 [Gammaproteobacteria bacterium]|nr:hypothetical protein [Gammaproteobacteria bacterium]
MSYQEFLEALDDTSVASTPFDLPAYENAIGYGGLGELVHFAETQLNQDEG